MQKSSENSSGWPRFEVGEPDEKQSRLSLAVFVLLCITLISTTIAFGAVDHIVWVPLLTFTLLILVLWALDGVRSGAIAFNANTLLLPLGGLIVIGVVQLLPLFSNGLPDGLIQDPSRASISLDPYATRLFLIRLVVYLVFFAASLTFLNTKARIKSMVVLIIGFGAVMAIFAILQRLSAVEGIYGLRPTPGAVSFGPFVNQHHFAAFMEMTGGVAFGFMFAGDIKRDKRILLVFSAVVMGIAVVMTSSRGGFIGFVSALVFAQLAHFLIRPSTGLGKDGTERGRRRFLAAAGSVALMIVIFGSVIFLGADSAMVRWFGLGGGDVSNGRGHFWAIALQIFLHHPILGAGLDAFGNAFPKYDDWTGVYRVEQAHNDYLQTLADAGIAGLACVAAYIYLLVRQGLAVVVTTSGSFRRASSIGALAGCFGIVIHSFFDFPLRTPSNAFFFLMLSALAVVSIHSKRHHRTRTKSSR